MRRRSAAMASRARVCAFSFTSSASRAARHCSGVTMSGLAVLILVSWCRGPSVLALHLVSGAGQSFSTCSSGLHEANLVLGRVADPDAVLGEHERERALAGGELTHVVRVPVDALERALRRVRDPHRPEPDAHVLG